MQLHILSKNTEGKSLEDIKASQIQEVKVPKSFEELHQVLLFYSGITSILFGTRSALTEGVKSFASAILTKKIIFKGRIATNGKPPPRSYTRWRFASNVGLVNAKNTRTARWSTTVSYVLTKSSKWL